MIVHLAAQAGVLYSLKNPKAYLSSNVLGSFNILEVARKQRNLIVSAETFSYLGKDNMMEPKDYLALWSDVIIVSTIATFAVGLVLSTTKS